MKIAIFGVSGQADVITEMIEKLNDYLIVCYVSTITTKNTEKLGLPIISENELKQKIEYGQIDYVVIAIGDNYTRYSVAKRLSKEIPNIKYASLVDPSAQVSDKSVIGPGSVVLNGAIVGPNCKIGDHCLINKISSIDHDSIMEDFSSCAPGVICGGNLTLGKRSALCIGCIVSNKINIGKNTVVGAGSVVVKDIESYVVAFGQPAKKMKTRQKADKYIK